MRRLACLCSIAAIIAVTISAQAQTVFSTSKPTPKYDFSLGKIFIEGAGTDQFRDISALFGTDHSIKAYPPRLDGSSMFAGVGVQFKPSMSVSLRGFRQSAAGLGPWRRLTGDPVQDAFAATANGDTYMSNKGLAGVFTYQHPIGKMLTLRLEAGAGFRGTTKVSFHGIVTATDPQDGQTFQMPASDRVSRRTPTAIAGVGFHYRLPFLPGVQVGPMWEVILPGYSKPLAPFISMKLFPLHIFSRSQ